MQSECLIKPYAKLGIELRIYSGILQPFAAHSHDDYVIGRVDEGCREMICNAHTFTISSGDLLVFNPGDVHECCSHDEKPFSYTSLVIESGKLESCHLAGPVIKNAEALETFDQLVDLLGSSNNASLINKILDQLCATLESCEKCNTPNQKSPRNKEFIQQMQHSMRAQIPDIKSLDSFAKNEGISKFSFIRAYKENFHITPFAHLSSFKVERACHLLSEGLPPVKVATKAGFADQAHLTRVFKQQIGTTPKAYQQMLIGEGNAKQQ